MTQDKQGRSFKKLRVSLTHNCNYACVYCSYGNKPEEIQTKPALLVPEKKILPIAELLQIIQNIHTVVNLISIRLTGGEPLLHPALTRIISAIREMGIPNIGMTTNGHLLANKAKLLHSAGLKSVNISIDALTETKFIVMSRYNGLSRVLKAIDACKEIGLKVKLNTVVVAGSNDSEILPLLDFALKKGILIRFLELMPMGPLHQNRNGHFFSSNQILETIQTRYNITPSLRENGATANYWSIDGKNAFGIIANDSSPFCSDCNRLRLDSYGNIYGCLSSLIPVPVEAKTSQNELKTILATAITHKQATHFIGNSRTMQSIGG
jgi:cyclic pyranopterin phosphate synthase